MLPPIVRPHVVEANADRHGESTRPEKALARRLSTPARALVVIAVLLHSFAVHAAPIAPDSGQTIRELEQRPGPGAPQTAPQLNIEDDTSTGTANDIRFMVNSIRIGGNSVIGTPELQALVSDLPGGEHSLAELDAAAARITGYYRAHGYVVARAYIPAQDIKNGVVVIDIIEGRVGQHRLDNRSRLSDDRAHAYLRRVKKGEVIKGEPIERSLLLLNDTPGVGGSRATLHPGASVGTSDLIVELNRAALVSGNIEIDNYGNRYTGEYRASATVNLNSPLRIGDQLTVSGLASGQDLNYGRIAYQIPVASSALRIGAAYFDIRYRLGKDFSALSAHGKANSGSVFGVYNLIRSQSTNLTETLTFEKKELTDYVDATTTVTNKDVRLAKLGLAGIHQDTLGGGGISSADLSVVIGQLTINSPGALAIDQASARSDGRYTKFSYSGSRLQRLTDNNHLYLSFSGQRANKNLDSSEKFSLGGAYGVRAYPQGEGIGDEGYLAILELRHKLSGWAQCILFYDTGSVTINHSPFGPAAPNTRNLSGAGFGANVMLVGLQIKASLAWRTGGGQPTSIPAGAVNTPNFWLQVGKVF